MAGEPNSNNNQDPNQNVNQSGAGGGGAGEAPKVELDAATYNQLLDTLAAYEAMGVVKGAPNSGGGGSDDDLDDIDELLNQANQGGGGGGGGPKKSLDDMTNSELVEFVMQAGEQRFRKVEVGLEIVKLAHAIDKVAAKHEDFKAYEDDIKTLAIRNPTLDIEEAYQLAKVKNPAKGAQKGGTPPVKTRVETILNLPSRHPVGEKPSETAGGATNATGGVKSLKTAAEEAWDEVVGKAK